MSDRSTPEVLVIGAGPAGLAAALEAARGHRVLVVEAAPQVGGLARTLDHDGNLFDVGGHRFLTQDPEVLALWRELLGERWREVPRRSRIAYRGRFFAYPLQATDALTKLGPVESATVLASYLRALLVRDPPGDDLESWLVSRFGRRLYEIFFRTYSEKLWGRPCAQIHAAWASQRIQGLSLARAVLAALGGRRDERTLAGRFLYPSRGPGELWQAMVERLRGLGGELWLDCPVRSLRHVDGAITHVEVMREGALASLQPRHVVWTAPLTTLLDQLAPSPPAAVRGAAAGLVHRAYLTVHLVVEGASRFDDQWVYVHDPEVQVGRVQNLGNWSPALVRDPATTSLGFEYFCDQGDALWSMSDDALVDLARTEGQRLGLLGDGPLRLGRVVREAHAYPVYPLDLEPRLATVRAHLLGFSNLRLAGRGATHRYGNMDHAMADGLHAARSLDDASRSPWPAPPPANLVEALPSTTRAALVRSFARLDEPAFAVACGLVTGASLLLATLIIVGKGGQPLGPTLALLQHYLPGYSVSVQGSAIAFGYGLLWGFLGGWLFATLRNLLLAAHVYTALRRARGWTLRRFLDQL